MFGGKPVFNKSGCSIVNSPFSFVVSVLKNTLETWIPFMGSLLVILTTFPLISSNFIFLGGVKDPVGGRVIPVNSKIFSRGNSNIIVLL